MRRMPLIALLLAALLYLQASAQMVPGISNPLLRRPEIKIIDLGTNSNTTGATLAITLAVDVPAGALICVVYGEFTNSSTLGTIADSASNTYTAIGTAMLPNGTAASHGEGGLFYAKNASALVAGQTITVTKNASNAAVISAFYATGVDLTAPLDTAVTASATGSSTTPSVTSGSPAVAGELFVGALYEGNTTAAPTVTQDTTNGWAFPFTTKKTGAGSNEPEVSGGNQVNSGTGTKIFAPTLGASQPWAVRVVGFKPL